MDRPFKHFIFGLFLVILKVHDSSCQVKPGRPRPREPRLQPHEGYSYPEYKPFFPFPPPPPPNIPFTLEHFLKHREYEMKFGDKLRKYAKYYNSPGYTPPPKNMPNPNIEYEVEYPYNPHVYLPPPSETPQQNVPPPQQPQPTPNTHQPHPHSRQFQNGPNPQHSMFNPPPIPNKPLVSPQQFPIPNLEPPIHNNHQSQQAYMQPHQNDRHWSHQQSPPVHSQPHQYQPYMHPHPQPYVHQPQPNMHQPQPNMHQPQSNMHQPPPNIHHPQPNMHPPQPHQYHPQPNMHQMQPNQHQSQSNHHQHWNQHQSILNPAFQHSPFSAYQPKPNIQKSLPNLMSSQQNQFNQYQQMVGGPETLPASQMNSQQHTNQHRNSQIQPNFQNVHQNHHVQQTTNLPLSLPGVQDLKSVAHRHHPPPSHSLPLPSRHHSMQQIEPQSPKQDQHPIKHMLSSPAAAMPPLEPPSQKSGIPGSIREYIQKPRSNTKGLLLALQKYLMQLTKAQKKPSVVPAEVAASRAEAAPWLPPTPVAPSAKLAPVAPEASSFRTSVTNEPSFRAPDKAVQASSKPQSPLPKAHTPMINSEASLVQIPLQSQHISASTSLNPSLASAIQTQPTMVPKIPALKEPTVIPVSETTAIDMTTPLV